MHQAARDPSFVVVGAMRSGTTSLHHWLRQHPAIFLPTSKELHYFDLHYDRGREWYDDQFADARPGQLLGEATPEYMFLPWARERLTRDLPGARLVVTLRNPVERAWSHYCMLRERGRESLSFEDALKAEDDRLREPSSWSRYGYTAKGRYAEQLQDLFERQGAANVLVLLFERDVVARPAETLHRVCKFIGVNDARVGDCAVGRPVNVAVHVRSPRLRLIARRLPKPLQDAIGRINSTPKPNDPMPDRLRRQLESRFHDSNQALEQLLGIELPEWTRTGAGAAWR